MDVATANATACATLVDEWVRCGVRHAVIAPGSRSTPMALALTARDELATHVVHDERVAAFVGLGIGLDGVPAVVLCTSGTAAANFLPAIVEAGLSEVPMIVATADRPPELRGVGAPQTIDQVGLYGRHVRWSHDAAVPDTADPTAWRPLAQRAFTAAAAGPVHLNLPFREPLVGSPAEPPEPIGDALPVPRGIAVGGVDAAFDRPRGVIVAGGCHHVEPAAIGALAGRLGWPLLTDPLSGCRQLPRAITAFDALLRDEQFAGSHTPGVVVRFGRPPASKVLSQWIVATGAPMLQVGGPGVVNPDGNVVAFCGIDDLAALTGAADGSWCASWSDANDRAEAAIDAALGAHTALTEPGVARAVCRWLPDDVDLVAASSMPIRDVEWFGGRWARAHSNRGANGIDGVLSTALGRALGGHTVVALVGDIAFVHDANALVAIGHRQVDLRIVVVDNDGGGIFSFLPQASALTTQRFEQLFGTPHGTDIAALAAAHGVGSRTVTTVAELCTALDRPGPSVIRVATDRAANVSMHAALNAAVAAALDA